MDVLAGMREVQRHLNQTVRSFPSLKVRVDFVHFGIFYLSFDLADLCGQFILNVLPESEEEYSLTVAPNLCLTDRAIGGGFANLPIEQLGGSEVSRECIFRRCGKDPIERDLKTSFLPGEYEQSIYIPEEQVFRIKDLYKFVNEQLCSSTVKTGIA